MLKKKYAISAIIALAILVFGGYVVYSYLVNITTFPPIDTRPNQKAEENEYSHSIERYKIEMEKNTCLPEHPAVAR